MAVPLGDLAAVARRAAGADEADVRPERGEDVGLHLGQLLGEVHDPRRPRLQAQGRAEALIGSGVDAGDARPAEVEWDPVRLAVG